MQPTSDRFDPPVDFDLKRAVVHGAATSSGRSHVTLGAFNAEVLAAQVAGVMIGIELIDPPVELVERLAAMGRELTARFDVTAVSASPASSER